MAEKPVFEPISSPPTSTTVPSRSPHALCVLGCRSGSTALARRAEIACRTYLDGGLALAVACGGRAWGGVVEADELARRLAGGGVPADAIVRERCSLDTRDNARFAAALLARRGLSRVIIVTCAWHLPRAERLFRTAGLDVVEGIGVEPLNATRFQQWYWRHRERAASWNDLRRGHARIV